MKYEHEVGSELELIPVTKIFLDTLPKEQRIICLEGEMGVGKTTFTQYLFKAMGIEEFHGSPTFPIINEYSSPIYGRVYHLDLYRINSEEELYDIGIEEIIYGDGIAFIEWPQKVENMLSDEIVRVQFSKKSNGKRIISWETEEE